MIRVRRKAAARPYRGRQNASRIGCHRLSASGIRDVRSSLASKKGVRTALVTGSTQRNPVSTLNGLSGEKDGEDIDSADTGRQRRKRESGSCGPCPRRLTRSVSRSNMHSSGYVRVRLGIWLPLCIRTRAEGFSQPEEMGSPRCALPNASTPFPAAHRWAVRFPPQADRSRKRPGCRSQAATAETKWHDLRLLSRKTPRRRRRSRA